MPMYCAVITLTGTAIQVTGQVTDVNSVAYPSSGAMATKIEIEPLRGNAHASYVGRSDVTNNGTGASVQELMLPATGVPLDRFIHQAPGTRNIDPYEFYVNGTNTEKVKATIWTA